MAADVRILMLNYEYPPLGGGSAPVTRSLARSLASGGHRVDVVTMGFRGLPRREEEGRVRVLRLPALRRRKELSRIHEMASFLLSALTTLPALVRREPYDLCHCHFFLPTGLLPYALRRMRDFPPYVVTCHGSDVPGYNPDRFTRLHRLSPPALRRMAAAASAIIAPSAALERLLRVALPGLRTPLVRIPYGIEADRFRAATKERSILIASRLFARKGVHAVIDALSGIPPRGYRLEIAGDGPERASLEERARQGALPTSFHGWLPHERLDRLFERSRIFVLATSIDNFPASLLEAMAAGCAIVTTRAGGCPEVVGDAALLVDPGDVGQLRESLRRLMQDDELAVRLGERARERALRSFSWPAVVTRHEEVYREAVGKSSRKMGRTFPS